MASPFCEECGKLRRRQRVQGEVVTFCPKCDGTPTTARSRRSKRPRPPSGRSSKASFSRPPRSSRKPSTSRSTGSKTEPSSTPADTNGAEAPDPPPKRHYEPSRLDVPDDLDLFPFESVRAGQDALLADVRRAVAEGRHLVAYAPTGLGKTAATLVPALEHALREGKRVFYLTGTQSQHRIAVETLKAMRERSGVPFVVGDVIGKQDMCARHEAEGMHYKRFAEFCRLEQARGTCTYWNHDDRDAVAELASDVHHVEETVDRASHEFHVCPHRAALNVAQQAHVVVCDYNYFFSGMGEAMAERLSVEPGEAVLIVDEAHNLPDRIRDHLTLDLNAYVLHDAAEELRDLQGHVDGVPTEHLVVVLEALAGLLEDLVEREPGEGPVQASLAEDDDGEGGDAVDANAAAAEDPSGYAAEGWVMDERWVPKDEWVAAVEDWMDRRVERLSTMGYDELVDELGRMENAYLDAFKQDPRGIALVREFLSNWRVERRGLVRVLARNDDVPRLTYGLLDPRVLSRRVFDEVHASVLMSGTLYPTAMYRDVLGLAGDRTDLREYDDPFPDDHRRVVCEPSVTTQYQERDGAMYDRIAGLVADVADATPGNVAAFFPSYGILGRVRERLAGGGELSDRLRGRDLLVEERAQGKAAKQDLVGTLGDSGDALLLAVMGGSLSEGYDYPDNRLKGVVVVGMPFARPTLSTQALIDHYKEIFGGRGYVYAYVQPAMNRVLQAAGRAIRSADDRAVVVLADERFTWDRYRRCLPDDRRPGTVEDVAGAVKGFWERTGAGAGADAGTGAEAAAADAKG